MPENARSLRPTLGASKCQVSLTARMKGIRGQLLNLGEDRMRIGRSELGVPRSSRIQRRSSIRPLLVAIVTWT